MTHYIPYFTRERRRLLETYCGEFIGKDEHSNEPTCATCQAKLEQDVVEDEATAVALEAEFPEYAGKLVQP